MRMYDSHLSRIRDNQCSRARKRGPREPLEKNVSGSTESHRGEHLIEGDLAELGLETAHVNKRL